MPALEGAAMNERKRLRLERAGWRSGTVQQFLGLTDAAAAYIETSVLLAAALRAVRRRRRMSLGVAARTIGTTTAAVGKLEAGNPSATIDELLGALLALGISPRRV